MKLTSDQLSLLSSALDTLADLHKGGVTVKRAVAQVDDSPYDVAVVFNEKSAEFELEVYDT